MLTSYATTKYVLVITHDTLKCAVILLSAARQSGPPSTAVMCSKSQDFRGHVPLAARIATHCKRAVFPSTGMQHSGAVLLSAGLDTEHVPSKSPHMSDCSHQVHYCLPGLTWVSCSQAARRAGAECCSPGHGLALRFLRRGMCTSNTLCPGSPQMHSLRVKVQEHGFSDLQVGVLDGNGSFCMPHSICSLKPSHAPSTGHACGGAQTCTV